MLLLLFWLQNAPLIEERWVIDRHLTGKDEVLLDVIRLMGDVMNDSIDRLPIFPHSWRKRMPSTRALTHVGQARAVNDGVGII